MVGGMEMAAGSRGDEGGVEGEVVEGVANGTSGGASSVGVDGGGSVGGGIEGGCSRKGDVGDGGAVEDCGLIRRHPPHAHVAGHAAVILSPYRESVQ